MIVTVDAAAGRLRFAGHEAACRIGRGGTVAAAAKREGDGATPLGDWPVRCVLIRPDRGLAPPAALPWRWLREADGWSDDPADPMYNRPVRHPHRFSAERMWRADAAYDAVLVLGHNDAPPVPGAGSAIFLHLTGEGATAGCVAVASATMAALLAGLGPGSAIHIQP